MEQKDYTTSIIVRLPALKVFDAINDVTKWWTENLEGSSKKLNDEFTVRFGEVHYSKQKLTELIPGKKIVWLITDSRLNFIQNKQEWTNTSISFVISSQNGQTVVQFTHHGLVPAIECFDACSNAWAGYINGSLFKWISSGKGNPNLKTTVS